LHRFLIVLEKTSDSYTVYAPDLPGCVATGSSREDRSGAVSLCSRIRYNLTKP